ncbi:class IV adenylate cyclase [Glycomyces sp. NPDC047369]
MIEVELKARVKDVETVRTWLQSRAEEEEATYHDTYYDWPDHRLDAEGQEIRLRSITTSLGVEHVLTFKEAPVDLMSRSKPEYETIVQDPGPIDLMLRNLGMAVFVQLIKECKNYRFRIENTPIFATLVILNKLDVVLLEVETHANRENLHSALQIIHGVMNELGVGSDLDSTPYTNIVRGIL